MSNILRYTDLVVWQKAMSLASDCYRVTAGFPRNERYGVTVQLRASAVSVAANVAEGHGRRSPRDFHRFLDIAYGSLNELKTYLHLSIDLGFCTSADADALLDRCEELGRMINGLQRSLRRATPRIRRSS